jgi:hypothetical protein
MDTEVKMSEIPNCDIHAAMGQTRKAAYDGATKMGPWAYMCEVCFKMHGVGLGTGRGQKLVQA